jgi:hypothetical protein
MEIYEPNTTFGYDKVTLANPQPIQGGSYITKITMDNDKPLYVQFPKCCTKQSIVTTKRGKYCDLMYERERHEELVHWIENLESICQDKLDEKKSLWFTADLSRDDIGHLMSPIARLYKSGKYLLIRTHIHTDKHTGLDKCMAYDEDQVNVDISTIEPGRDIIPLVLIDGIRYSSRSFEINIKLTQFMAIDKTVELMNTCMIKHRKPDNVEDTDTPVATISESLAMAHAPILTGHISNKNETETFAPVENNAVHEVDNPATQYDLGEDDSSISSEHLEKPDVETDPDTSFDFKTNASKILSDEEQNQKDDLVSGITEPCIKDDPSNDTSSQPGSLEGKSLGSLEEPVRDTGSTSLEEIDLEPDDSSESITLKKPNEVYYEIYRTARQKAKHMRQVAVEAYLEAKQIKSQYMLSDIDDSEDDMDFAPGGDQPSDFHLEEN